MSDAPERIYASPSELEGWSRIGHWNVEFGWDLDDVEYVRWDVVRSLEDKLVKAVEALGFYAAKENWDDGRFLSEGVDGDGVHIVNLEMSSVTKDYGKIASTTLAELTKDAH